jgi:hypothetical protein
MTGIRRKVQLANLLIFVGLIQRPVVEKQRFIDPCGLRPVTKDATKVDAQYHAAQVQ